MKLYDIGDSTIISFDLGLGYFHYHNDDDGDYGRATKRHVMGLFSSCFSRDFCTWMDRYWVRGYGHDQRTGLHMYIITYYIYQAQLPCSAKNLKTQVVAVVIHVTSDESKSEERQKRGCRWTVGS